MATEKDQLKQARTVFDTICEYLDKHDWHYEKDEDNLKVQLATKGDDLVIPILIKVNTDLMIVSIYSPMTFNVPEDSRIGMTVAIIAANYRIVDGSFDYNVKEGTIVYRITSSYRDSIIGENLIEYLLMCACFTTDAYNDKFEKIVKEGLGVDEMLNLIYKDKEEE